MKRKFKYILVLAGCLVGLTGCEGEAVVFENSEASRNTYEAEHTETATEETEQILVHVCGAVQIPGVITIQSGARVNDAITMAGGMTSDADTDYLNLAAVLCDGEKVYVPTVEEVLRWEVQQGRNELVNINTADEIQLCMLPGIGESKAKDIIMYRKENGEFQTIEDIMKVPGIKDSLFQKIKELIDVK